MNINVTKKFSKKTFMAYNSKSNKNLSEKKADSSWSPTEINIDGAKVSLLMFTYLKGSHFRSIFLINNRLYGYDDMKSELEYIIKHIVTSCYNFSENFRVFTDSAPMLQKF